MFLARFRRLATETGNKITDIQTWKGVFEIGSLAKWAKWRQNDLLKQATGKVKQKESTSLQAIENIYKLKSVTNQELETLKQEAAR